MLLLRSISYSILQENYYFLIFYIFLFVKVDQKWTETLKDNFVCKSIQNYVFTIQGNVHLKRSVWRQNHQNVQLRDAVSQPIQKNKGVPGHARWGRMSLASLHRWFGVCIRFSGQKSLSERSTKKQQICMIFTFWGCVFWDALSNSK